MPFFRNADDYVDPLRKLRFFRLERFVMRSAAEHGQSFACNSALCRPERSGGLHNVKTQPLPTDDEMIAVASLTAAYVSTDFPAIGKLAEVPCSPLA